MDTFNNKGLVPGKKALVVGARLCFENIGKIVEIVHFVDKGGVWCNEFGEATNAGAGGWICQGENLLLMLHHPSKGWDKVPSSLSSFLPEHLMPLDDDEGMCDNVSEEQTKEKEHAS